MSGNARAALGKALGLAGLIAVLDQATKWFVLLEVMQPPRIIEVTGFFNLVLTYNRGVSFGLLAGGSPWQPYVLSVISLLIVLALLYWLRQQTNVMMILAVGMVSGGALGNVIDRFIHPGVVDFLDFHYAGWHWPAFNLADSAIVAGVALLLWDGLFGEQDGVKD
ncbi:MAG: signal peptidase II [Pseudomonadota bacterium]|uniref:signal peptidase II n=1 Tax=Fodinicurvata fenggangensis TaxID=1121830 RepID=UPI000559139C|nr:signal peptidase II [Fodinicurvata fenggangensis]